MKYGIYFAYWEKTWGCDQKKYIEKVRDLGFDILEISCAALKNMSREEMQAFRDEAKAQGVMLTAGYGPAAEENLASADPKVSEHVVAFYTDLLKKLEFMDIHTIGGGIYSYWPVDYSKPIDKEGDWARSVANVKKVGKIAGECGVDYCLEVLNRFEGYILNTSEEAVRFVKEVDVPAVKVMLDTFHMNIEEDSMDRCHPDCPVIFWDTSMWARITAECRERAISPGRRSARHCTGSAMIRMLSWSLLSSAAEK